MQDKLDLQTSKFYSYCLFKFLIVDSNLGRYRISRSRS